MFDYQHIPEYLHPVAFSMGFIFVSWYALMYILALCVGGYILWRQLRVWMSFDQCVDIAFNITLGILIGSRLGFVLLYNFAYYRTYPLAIICPFDLTNGNWIGIAGMSYFGGLVGAIVGVWLFVRQISGDTRTRTRAFWKIADALAYAVPLGYIFGRVGNFLNGELYGRVTEKFWGMYFPTAPLGDTLLRHPSQLYEAFFEGVVLFCIVAFIRRRYYVTGAMALAYIGGYSFFRFCLEFFREPDPQIGFLFGWMTLGQILAIAVFVLSISYYLRSHRTGK